MSLRSACALLVVALLVTAPPAAAEVGYYSPGGIWPEFAEEVDSAVVNADTVRLKRDLAIAAEHGLVVHLALPGIIQHRVMTKRPQDHPGPDDGPLRKRLAPTARPKIFDFIPDEQLVQVVRGYLEVAREYPGTLGTVFLVDEPYLNGVSRSELERVGALVRRELDAAGMLNVSLGVVFAGAMFNAGFAATMDAAAFDYVEEIDRHIADEATSIAALPAGRDRDRRQQDYDSWLDAVAEFRLTTYDQAGNMYTGGGLPRGFDVVGFDMYLSTVLMDGLYEQAIAWLAKATETPTCDGYEALAMSAFRRSLSFFTEGSTTSSDASRATDKKKLDRLYDCRVDATLELLRREIATAGTAPSIVVVTEASANGVLEFDSRGMIEDAQPRELVEARIEDEVSRALQVYAKGGIDHLLFFTFGDEFDEVINLSISGISKVRQARELVRAASDRHARE